MEEVLCVEQSCIIKFVVGDREKEWFTRGVDEEEEGDEVVEGKGEMLCFFEKTFINHVDGVKSTCQ